MTGGGKEPPTLEPTTEKLLSMLGTQVKPLVNLVDCGSVYHHGPVDDESSCEVAANIEVTNDEVIDDPNIEIIYVDNTAPSAVNTQKGLTRKFPLSNDDVVYVDKPIKVPTAASIHKVSSRKFPLSNDDANLEDILVEKTTTVPQASNIQKVASRKFPPSNKRKETDRNDDYIAAKKVRLDEKSQKEEELVELKRRHYLTQNIILELQLSTAKLQNDAAALDVQIKTEELKKVLQSNKAGISSTFAA